MVGAGLDMPLLEKLIHSPQLVFGCYHNREAKFNFYEGNRRQGSYQKLLQKHFSPQAEAKWVKGFG